MRRVRRLILAMLLLSGVLSVWACSNDGGAVVEGPRPSSNIVLKGNVLILTDDAAKDVQVEDGRLLVPGSAKWLQNVAPGTVLASGYGNGFLRRVKAISTLNAQSKGVQLRTLADAVTELLTDYAALEDAVNSGTFSTGDIGLPPIDADLAKMFGQGDVGSVKVSIPLSLRLEGRFDGGQMTEFSLRLAGTGQMTAAFRLTEHKAGEDEVFASAPLRTTFMIGPLPVVLISQVKDWIGFSFDTSIAAFDLGATCTAAFEMAVTFREGVWAGGATAPTSCDFKEPSLTAVDGSTKFDVHDRVRTTTRFYGVAGLFAEGKIGLRHAMTVKIPKPECPDATYRAASVLAGEIGAEAELFSKKVASTWVKQEAEFPIMTGKWPKEPLPACNYDDDPDPEIDGGSDGGSDAGLDGATDLSDASGAPDASDVPDGSSEADAGADDAAAAGPNCFCPLDSNAPTTIHSDGTCTDNKTGRKWCLFNESRSFESAQWLCTSKGMSIPSAADRSAAPLIYTQSWMSDLSGDQTSLVVGGHVSGSFCNRGLLCKRDMFGNCSGQVAYSHICEVCTSDQPLYAKSPCVFDINGYYYQGYYRPYPAFVVCVY